MSQNTDQLYTGIAYSYIEYVHAYLELLNNSLFFSTPYLDEETAHIQNELKKIFLYLPELLTSNETTSKGKNTKIEKERVGETLLNFRDKLEQKYRSLNSYRRELHHLVAKAQNDPEFAGSYIDHEEFSDEAILQMDFDRLAEDCTNFVFKDKSLKTKQLHASSILPAIPLKITKANFLDYVKKSIHHIDIEDTVEAANFLTSILTQLFDGKRFEFYGQDFGDFTESLAELTTYDDPIDFFEEADSLEQTINTLFELLRAMYRMICTLSNLLLFEHIDFNTLTELHPSFFDFYHCIKKILTDANDASFLKASLGERVDEVQKEVQSELIKVSKKKEADPMFILIQTYLSMDMSSLFGFTMKKDKQYSKETLAVLDNFVDELGHSLSEIPTTDRKLRMQYFMSSIPFVMPEATFKSYVSAGFRNISKPQQTLLAAMALHSILEQGGYFTSNTDEDPGMVPEDIYKEYMTEEEINELHGFDYEDVDYHDEDITHHHHCNCDDDCDCGDDCSGSDNHSDCNCGDHHHH